MKKGFISFFCIFLIVIQSVSASAASSADIERFTNETADFVLNAVPEPQFGSIGGEWAVFGLARCGAEVPEGYFDRYYSSICSLVSEQNGVLHEKKYTEYSRLIIALTSIGKNPSDVGGYNLLSPLGDYEKTVWQGLNGSIWALLALDCGGYEIPQNPTAEKQATRDMYISRILDSQHADGGFSLSDDGFDTDISAMALLALSKYNTRKNVREATERALIRLSEEQDADGAYSSAESCAQVLTALCALEIPIDDSRFVKNGKSVFDGLMSYRAKDGGFMHTKDIPSSNLMATEQGLYALAALKRMTNGETGLFSISTEPPEKSDVNSPENSNLRHKDVRATQITNPDASFSDISEVSCRSEICELAKRGIINGKSADTFDPDGKMTRAEFAAITVRALGLPSVRTENVFTDNLETDWFFGYVNTAYAYKIANGVSASSFNPNATITLEEAAVMVSRAAALCGIDCAMSDDSARDFLAVFTDYTDLSDWAFVPAAACVKHGIISDSELELLPKHEVTRTEIALMLFNLLRKADLL